VQKVTVQVEVSKEAYELGQGVAKFVTATKAALADGWQAGQDLPAVMSSAISDLIPALEGVQQIPDEAQDKQALVNALYLSLSPLFLSATTPAPTSTPA